MNKDNTNQNPKTDKSMPKSDMTALDLASSIINNSSDTIIATNLNGEITLWNNGAVRLYGYTREEALGKNISIIYREEDLPALGERIQKVIQGKNISNAEATVIDKFKNEYTVLLSIDGVKDKKGKINQLVGLTKDITEKKQSENNLRESELKFSQAFDNSPIPVSILNLTTGKRLAVNNAFIKTFGYSKDELIDEESIYKINLAVDQKEFQLIVKKAIRDRAIFEHPFSMYSKAGEIRHTLVNATKAYDSNEDIFIFSLLDVTERKKTQKEYENAKEKAEISEIYLDNIINNIGDPVFVKDEQSKLLLVNEAFCTLFDLARDKIIGKTLAEDILPDEQEGFLKIDKQVLKTGKENIVEESLTIRGGQTRTIYTRKTRYIDSNDKKYLIGVIRDITERKNVERELKKAQQIARVGNWYLDILTEEIVWSDELYKMYGFDPTLPIPPYSEHEKFLTPESWELLTSSIENTRNTGVPYAIELKTNEKSGINKWKWIFAQGEAVLDSGNKIIALRGTAQDITERKKAEENLHQKGHIIESASSAIATSDLDGNMTYGNPAFKKLWRFDHDEDYLNKPFTNYWLLKENEESINTSLTDKGYWEGELKAKRKDGSEFDVQVSAAMVNDGDGNPVGLMSSSVDITKNKQIEKELVSSNLELNRSSKRYKGFISASNTGAWEFDNDREYLWCSPEYFTMLGRNVDDYNLTGALNLDETWVNLLHPEDRERSSKKFADYLSGGSIGMYENYFRMQHTDGSWVWIWSRGSTIRDENGNLTVTIGTHIDITERKIAEETLKESEEKYRTLFEQSMIGIGMSRGNEVVFVNKALLKIWKYDSLEEYKKVSLIDHIAPEYQEMLKNRIKEGLSNKGKNLPSEYQYDILCKDGEIKTVRGHTSYMQIGGEVYAQTIVKDVTKSVNQEKELISAKNILEESKIKFEILSNVSFEGIVIHENGVPVDLNNSFPEMFGYTKDEVLQEDLSKLVIRKDFHNLVLENIKNEHKLPYEVIGIKKDGTEFPIEIEGKTYISKENKKLRVTAVRDVTERKKAEENIKQTLSQLNLAVDTAKLGVWTHNIETGRLIWNSELFEMFGIAPSEFDYSVDMPLKLVHPEDLEYVKEQQGKVFQNESVSGFDFRIIRPNKEVRYIYATVTPIFDEEENLTKIIGINLDVTERKKAKEKIEQANLELIDAVSSLNELKKQLEDQNVYLKDELGLVFNFEEMVYGSAIFGEVLTDLERVAPTDATVLILGESGTGKELLARALHNLSLRKNEPFIKVNCSAIPTELIESELFGHKKGAFTGAVSDKVGKFELAEGGTLFLDEIGDLPLAMQPKLLRFLQEGEMEVVGGTVTRSLDVRIVAATNKDLKTEVEKSQFREDLYFRLNVFPIEAPALRKRKEDIPLLIEHFVDKFGKKYRKNIKYISDSAMQDMRVYNWPGNIRELENLVERSVILSDSETLIFPGFGSENSKRTKINSGTNLTLNDVQRNHILSVLEKTNWKVGGPDGAALILDIKPSTFRDKMKKLGIKRPN